MSGTIDPLAASTRLGAPSAVPTSESSEGVDPLAAATRLGGGNPLTTAYEKVPTSTSRGLVLGTRNAVEGPATLPMAVLDAATWPTRALMNLFPGEPTPAPSTMLDRGVTALGVPEAKTEAEKRNAEIIRGGSSMLLPMGIGRLAPNTVAAIPPAVRPMVGTTPTTLPLAASQVVAGGAGALAGDVLAGDERVPEWMKPTARLAGNMIGAGGVSALTGAAGTINNAIRGVKTPIAEALERLGIVPRTVGAVTDRPGLQKMEAVFSGTPVASGQLQSAQRQMVDEFGNAVHGTAQMLDPTTATPITTAGRAGNVVQSELMHWKNNVFPAEQAAVWDPLSTRLAGASVDPSSYRRALEQAARDPALNSLPEIQRSFIQARLQGWLEALNTDVPRGANMSWEQAMAVKRRIGDVMGTPDAVGDIGSSALKNVYGGLAGDMRTTAAAHGQGTLFDAANRVTTEGHQFLAGTASKAVRANNPAQETIRPDTAVRALLEDNTGMAQLRDRTPVAADAAAAWKLRDMMTPVASSQGDVSTGSFLTNLRKQARSDPEGQAALFTDPAVAQNVRDLETVANQFRSVEKNANTSKTGLTNYVLGAAGGLGGALTSGNLAAALSVLGGSVGVPYVAGKMLTSPTAIALASARAGPRPPIDSRVAGLLGHLTNQHWDIPPISNPGDAGRSR